MIRFILWPFKLLFRSINFSAQGALLDFAEHNAKDAYPLLRKTLLTDVLLLGGVFLFNIIMPIVNFGDVVNSFSTSAGHGLAVMFPLAIVGIVYGVVFLIFFPVVIVLLSKKYMYSRVTARLWNHNRRPFVNLLLQSVENIKAEQQLATPLRQLLHYQQLRQQLPFPMSLIYRIAAGKIPVLKRLGEVLPATGDPAEQLTELVTKEKKISPALPVLLLLAIAADVAGVLYFFSRF